MTRTTLVSRVSSIFRCVRHAVTVVPLRTVGSSVNSFVLLVFGLATVSVAGTLLVRDLRHTRRPTLGVDDDAFTSAPARSAIGRVAYGPRLEPYGWWRGGPSPIANNVFATFEFTRLRVDERIIEANVRLFVPRAIRLDIQDYRTTAFVERGSRTPFVYDWETFENGTRREKVRPEYATKKLFLQIETPFLRVAPVASSPAFSMEELFEPGSLLNDRSRPFQQKVELPLTAWTSSSYPNDWYSFVGAVRTSFDMPLILRTHELPDTALVVGDDLLEQRVTTFKDATGWMVAIVVERDTTTVLYVYAMSLVPIGFALLIMHQLFLRDGERPVGETLAAIVAAVLTVIGIRQVLVPPFIEGITRVDLILGFGLALVLFLTFTRYALDQWSRDRSPGGAA